MIQVTKAELSQCKRAVVVLSEINKVAVTVLREKDKLTPVKQDLLMLIKVLKRLDDVAT